MIVATKNLTMHGLSHHCMNKTKYSKYPKYARDRKVDERISYMNAHTFRIVRAYYLQHLKAIALLVKLLVLCSVTANFSGKVDHPAYT